MYLNSQIRYQQLYNKKKKSNFIQFFREKKKNSNWLKIGLQIKKWLKNLLSQIVTLKSLEKVSISIIILDHDMF